ncbi:MAG: radical SAM family heme chaperone HemW [Phycisphaerales bacterium JB039]
MIRIGQWPRQHQNPLRELSAAPEGGSRPASLYLHAPFCFHKCHYCDFYSIVDSRDRQEAFTGRLIRELEALAPFAARPLRTIFVGGGTPSLLRVELWERLLAALERYYDLSEIRGGRGEFTVECNPETVTPELMRALRAGGVDRVSVGAQSFEARHLKTLERWHEPANVGRALELARQAGIERTSVDLIFAIPGQTLEEWQRDLERGLEQGVEHMSCYALTYEPNTAMTKRMERGEFARADEELEADMYELTVETLGRAGLARYEVSNFARRGQESLHNLAYWRGEQWLAAGPSASAHVAGWRWKNVARLDDYLSGDDAGFAPAVDVEAPDGRRALVERIMMGIRLREGLERAGVLEEAQRAFGEGAVEAIEREAAALEAEGVLACDPERLRLTEAGFLLADLAARRLAPA